MADETFIEEFIEIADALAIWKFYPSGKDRGMLAVALMDWCDGKIERARWLLEQAKQFDEYPGPATLSGMIRDQFTPTGPLAKYEPEPVPESVLRLLPRKVRERLM